MFYPVSFNCAQRHCMNCGHLKLLKFPPIVIGIHLANAADGLAIFFPVAWQSAGLAMSLRSATAAYPQTQP